MNDTIFLALKFKWFSLAPPLVLLNFFVFYPFMGKPQVFYWTIRTLVYPSSFLWLKCPKMGEKCHKSSRKFHPVCLTHKTFFMVFKKMKKKYVSLLEENKKKKAKHFTVDSFLHENWNEIFLGNFVPLCWWLSRLHQKKTIDWHRRLPSWWNHFLLKTISRRILVASVLYQSAKSVEKKKSGRHGDRDDPWGRLEMRISSPAGKPLSKNR